MLLSEKKRYVVEIGKEMVAKDFSVPTDGNISFEDHENIYITRSNRHKGQLTTDDIIDINDTASKPSTETPLHLIVYKHRPDIKAVIHAHPPYATAFAVANISLSKHSMSEIVSTIGQIPVAKYGTPATDELPNSIEPLVKKTNAILLANHGAITYGKDLQEAWYTMLRIEHFARISFYAHLLGGEKEIPADEVTKLLHVRKNIYAIDTPQILDLPEPNNTTLNDIVHILNEIKSKL